MPVKLFISALIAALFLTGTALPISRAPGPGAPVQRSAETPAETLRLTGEEALDIALKHAGLTKAQISRLERDFGWDRDRPEWDIEFTCDGFEYSYEIHGESGTILEWEKERDR